MMTKVSFIYPFLAGPAKLEYFQNDFLAFFQKLPVDVELILIVDSPNYFLPPPQSSESLSAQLHSMGSELHQKSKGKISLTVEFRTRRTGRGPAVFRGITLATGDFIFINTMGSGCPFGDYFNLLHEMVSNGKTDVVLGVRKHSQKIRKIPVRNWKHFFEDVQQEKFLRQGFQSADPTSPVLGFNKRAQSIFLESIQTLPTWFYTPKLLMVAVEKNLHTVEIPINYVDSEKTSFSWWMGL